MAKYLTSPELMKPSFDLQDTKTRPKLALALSVLLVFLPGCKAMMVQQQIDSTKEQLSALQQAVEIMRLENLKRNSKCRGAEDTFTKLIVQTPDPQLQPVLDYLRRAYAVRTYMEEKHVTAETALAVVGDLLLPPQLPKELDPFSGCILDLGDPPDKPATYQGGKSADGWVFDWQSRDQETFNKEMEILDKYLPPEQRTTIIRFAVDYALALSRTLSERKEKGEITLLQFIKAVNAGEEYLYQQGFQYGAQLRENLIRAKAQDDALLATIAVGLGAVATAALVASASERAYRPVHCVANRIGNFVYIDCY